MKNQYSGWELESFDNAKNFRKYQIEKIKPYIKNLKIFDIGSGSGGLINYYTQYASEVSVYEPSNRLNNILNKKFKFKNVKIYKSHPASDKKFDTILFMDVIEHIKNYDNVLKIALKNLKKDGVLIINVPAFDFLFSDFDKKVGHLKRFSKKDFFILSKRHNLKILSLDYYDIVGFFLIFVSKFILKIHLKSTNVSRNIKIWDKMIPISKFLDALLLNQLGKSLLCVLKKNEKY